jgi:hypothetical protein
LSRRRVFEDQADSGSGQQAEVERQLEMAADALGPVFHEVWSQDLKKKADGARLKALLEKLQKEPNPGESRKII